MYQTSSAAIGAFHRKTGSPVTPASPQHSTPASSADLRSPAFDEYEQLDYFRRLQEYEYMKGISGEVASPVIYHIPPYRRSSIESLGFGKAATVRDILVQNLARYKKREVPVPADGNCQFSSIAFHVLNSADNHAHVREDVLAFMQANANLFLPYVAEDKAGFQDYLEKMERHCEWGDHVTLQAAADVYRIRIVVVTSHEVPDGCKSGGGAVITIRPRDATGTPCDPKREFWVSFSEEENAEHYNPLVDM